MEGHVDVAPDVRLWVQDIGDRASSPLLLVMGANASGLIWPDRFLASLAEHHHVIRYDHRDTGRSTWAFDDRPYAVADLAGDAVAVLDALGVERAHVVGMSMGGTLVQLLLLDHPERLLSATVVCTSALRSGLAPGDIEYEPGLPDPDPRLLALWERMADSRDREAEIAWRVEHWRLLNGEAVPFDAETFRRLEEGAIDHAGRHDNPAAHARAAQTGLDRGAELAGVRATLGERRTAIDRYLRAFEAQRLPESTCAYRLKDLDREVQGLEARAAALEAECDTTPTMATEHILVGVRGRIEQAAADGAPEQLKQLMGAVVDRIVV